MENKPVIRSMHSLSSSFLGSGKFLSEKCLESEQAIRTRKRDKIIEEHQAFFYGAIFNIVSYLEAYINELYVDISEGNFQNLNIEDDSLIQIRDLWKLNIPRTASFKTIDKYQIMLSICKKQKINTSTRPYQDVEILIKLRNSLIHYEPEYIESKFKNPAAQLHRFEKYLHGRIELNPFSTKLDDFYPIKIISYSCCDWALNSTIQFIKDFNKQIIKCAS